MGLFDGIVNFFKPVTTPLINVSFAAQKLLVPAVTGVNQQQFSTALEAQRPLAEQLATAGIIAGGVVGGVVAAPAIAGAIGGSSALGSGGVLASAGGLVSSHVNDITNVLSDQGSQLVDDGSDLPTLPYDDGTGDYLSDDLADFT